LAREPVLVDLSGVVHCACAGLAGTTGVTTTPDALQILEPPRASAPVLEPLAIDLSPQGLSRAPAMHVDPTIEHSPLGVVASAAVSTSTRSRDLPPRRRIAITPPGVAVMAAREPRRPVGSGATRAATALVSTNDPEPALELGAIVEPSDSARHQATEGSPRSADSGHESVAEPPSTHAEMVFASMHRARRRRALADASEVGVPEVTRAFTALRARRGPPHDAHAIGPDEARAAEATTSAPTTHAPGAEVRPPEESTHEVAEHPFLTAPVERAAARPPEPGLRTLSPPPPRPTFDPALMREIPRRVNRGVLPASGHLRAQPEVARRSSRLWRLLISVILIIAVAILLAITMGLDFP
jgi:hypothetical protein